MSEMEMEGEVLVGGCRKVGRRSCVGGGVVMGRRRRRSRCSGTERRSRRRLLLLLRALLLQRKLRLRGAWRGKGSKAEGLVVYC